MRHITRTPGEHKGIGQALRFDAFAVDHEVEQRIPPWRKTPSRTGERRGPRNFSITSSVEMPSVGTPSISTIWSPARSLPYEGEPTIGAMTNNRPRRTSK